MSRRLPTFHCRITLGLGAERMTSVGELLRAAELSTHRAVPWGDAVPLDAPGVYLIAISADPLHDTGLGMCPVGSDAVATLLRRRPEAMVDGREATVESVSSRLSALWLASEPVLYIGLAGTSVRARVGQYYRTKIGARAPHAGGWPLKMLANLDDLWVHFAPSDDPRSAEGVMVDEFMRGVSEADAARLIDPDTPLPFANLMLPGGHTKRHGFAGVKATR